MISHQGCKCIRILVFLCLNPEKLNIPSANIEAVIFDLGGVLLNIDYTLTIKAFRDLGMTNVEELFSQHQQDSFFDHFETGDISPKDFRVEVRKHLPRGITDQQIDEAWNALLLDFPSDRFSFVKKMSSNKRVFLLSNTNAIHMQWFVPKMKEWFGEDFFSLFEKAYLSHEIGMRKPNVEIFNWVLEQNNLSPESTLFVDDSVQHIEGAKNAGIQTHWLEPCQQVVVELASLLT